MYLVVTGVEVVPESWNWMKSTKEGWGAKREECEKPTFPWIEKEEKHRKKSQRIGEKQERAGS